MAWQMPPTWMLVVFLVAWVALALHAGLGVRRYGRRWWVWFLVSLFLTVLPAAIVTYVDHYRLLRRANDRMARARRGGLCPSCGVRLTPRDVRRVDGQNICPNCREPLGDERQV